MSSNEITLTVIGLGSPLMGDDGVGLEVAHRLKHEELPGSVEVLSAGTPGIDLIDMITNRERVIIVDAVKINEMNPSYGRAVDESSKDFVFIEPESIRKKEIDASVHEMGLDTTLILMRTLKMDLSNVTIIGIPIRSAEQVRGLSKEAEKKANKVTEHILTLIKEMRK
ncbi:MAG: hydrogenase maturation protease [Deltaproteobacteria bacterium]|nr:hydrogenase maturation protease [Deltaproteobacteria bacterium]